MTWFFQRRTRLLALSVCLCALGLSPRPAAAQNVEALAEQIAQSFSGLEEMRYSTVAVSRIRQIGSQLPTDELIDFINVKLVRTRRFKVVDRNRLQLILREQQIQLQDFVSAEKYKELGRVTGVDLFVHGTVYNDALVLKAIDVQNSAIAWADVFPLTTPAPQAAFLSNMGQGMARSLDKDLARLREEQIKLVSFWNFETNGIVPEASMMDYLSVALTQSGEFRVVDRENIQLIAEEQQLNQEVFIDESSAKQLGQLHGVDAFIYGGLTRRSDGTYLASLKMMNVYNGVIEWADLIRVSQEDSGASAAAAGADSGQDAAPPGMVAVPAGPFIMGNNGTPADARPAHRVELRLYHIDAAEVTNAEYAKFVEAKNHRRPVSWNGNTYAPDTGNLPVVGVTWDDADAYCRWAGKRLPTEEEWEKAARGTAGQSYPWPGSSFSPGFAVTREAGRKAPRGAQEAGRDVSPYGVKHMAGNVREWVESIFKPYPGNQAHADPAFGKERVVRGGSWATDSRSTLTYFRGSSRRNLAWQEVGFRCAQDG